ncbi:MAG: ATP-dependent helicase, partial [Pedosphaera parvula]|nr:ATP-dependent helicase [Pedosphaera parvula]
RELSDSKSDVAERTEILNTFAHCADSQRAWLLLEDYFERLALARRDFTGGDWWPRLLAAQGRERLEETALLFLRSNRPLPTELLAHANFERFAEIEQEEQEQAIVRQLENWLLPPTLGHLDAPRANLTVVCQPRLLNPESPLHGLSVEFNLFRPRTGDRTRSLPEIIELTARSAHEQELFAPQDWEFIQWLTEHYREQANGEEPMQLTGLELIRWLTRWGHTQLLKLGSPETPLNFHGQLAELTPHLVNHDVELSFTHRLALPGREAHALSGAKFFAGLPLLALVGQTFYLVRNTPPNGLLETWLRSPILPVRKLSHRLLTHLRKTSSDNGTDWDQLCITHTALPQFRFEIIDETVRLRLVACSERDQSLWQW